MITINKDGKLEIDICELLDRLSEGKKIELIESLSCQDSIIKHVSDQILTGWTENAYSGRIDYAIQQTSPLGKARQRVIELAPEVAREEIDRLKRFAKNAEEQQKKYEDMYYDLLNKREGRRLY